MRVKYARKDVETVTAKVTVLEKVMGKRLACVSNESRPAVSDSCPPFACRTYPWIGKASSIDHFENHHAGFFIVVERRVPFDGAQSASIDYEDMSEGEGLSSFIPTRRP